MTRREHAEHVVRLLKAIGFEATPHAEYGELDDPERDPDTGFSYTGGVYVQKPVAGSERELLAFGHGELRTLLQFADQQGLFLRLNTGPTIYLLRDA